MAVLELGVAEAEPDEQFGSAPGLIAIAGTARSGARLLWGLRTTLDLAAIAAAALVAAPGWMMVAYAALVALGLCARGAYRHPLSPSALDEVPTIAAVCGVSLLPLGLAGLAWTVPGSLLLQATLTLIGVTAARAGAYVAIRRARRQSALREPALIVGAGRVGIELYRALIDHPEYGLTPIGLVDDVPVTDRLPVVGRLRDLAVIARQRRARHILVAFGPTSEEESVAALRIALTLDVDVYVVPRYFELGLATSAPDVDDVWGIPLQRVHRAASRRLTWRIKRAIDIVVSGLALAAVAPILGVLALVVRFSSPGPILYRQSRVGQHGRPFEVLKFRTMSDNDDEAWSLDDDDPRLTAIGRWMRRLSLDELPQLFNIFRGDMSLVGPRPERPHFAERYARDVAGYGDRHRLPVGLTGLAQVNGLRGDTSIEHRARFDNAYIEGWSLWTDLKIVARTASEVLRHARRGR